MPTECRRSLMRGRLALESILIEIGFAVTQFDSGLLRINFDFVENVLLFVCWSFIANQILLIEIPQN